MKKTNSLKTPRKLRKSSTGERINFSPDVVRQIAFEAHLFCSCPTCCRFTSYATSTGIPRAIAEAAHINAASVNGPRPTFIYSSTYLKSAENGIWLCVSCHSKIDQDPLMYPERVLKNWKAQHASFIKQLVGKDFDLVHFEQYSRSMNVAQRVSFLAYVEGRRVLTDALNVEFPAKVLESLMEVRSRITSTLGHLRPEDSAAQILAEMRDIIKVFLTANSELDKLNPYIADPGFIEFCNSLQQLRSDLLPCIVRMAKDVDYNLSKEITDEYSRLSI